MFRLSITILFLGLAVNLFSQSPHGAQFKVNCADCHSSASWDIPYDAWDRTGPIFSKTTGWQIGWDTARFSHTKTDFPLTGKHIQVDCRACHGSMVFSEASADCISCHMDMHNGTVGNDCARCHNTDSWLVNNIPELHQDNGFPLLGAHAGAACVDCHASETNLRFDRIGNDCINCHRTDYASTSSPDHQGAGFSTNCVDCHDVTRFDWTTDRVNHDFFPLTKGHDISDCARCHTAGSYSNTPSDCISCHKNDFETAVSPNHQSAGFSQNCTECHTTDPDWMPALFTQHDAAYFPIYSGAHKGEWDACKDCHTNPSNYAEYTCVTCHMNPETDNQHNGVNGYSYNSPACLACHPGGNATDVFDHSKTQFPLTGAHLTADCIACHAAGYAGTPTDCASCHTPDYNQSANPSHTALAIPTDCATCHTTDAWQPASFPIHNNYYALNGAHAAVANDCAACHNGDYNNTPNTCAGCHTPDYNQTTNPNHAAQQFPTDCATCHSETAWVPATFDHNSFYPLTGAHAAISNDCNACHNGDYNNTPNTCAGCHTPDYNQTTNPNHAALAIPTDCATCHTPDGWAPASFAIHNNYYPLTGAHAAIANDCNACHNGNYTNTPNTCAGCHTPDYTQTTNPNHVALAIPTDCATCHTPDGWAPASFAIHSDYYTLNGAHAAVANDCAACHNGDYNNTPNTCAGCHTPDYNQTTNPNHIAAQFPTDCASCHSETAWVPATFDHDGQYFPIYSGAHQGQWDQCVDCHTDPSNFSVFTCTTCHANPETDNQHNGVNGYVYNSPACLACHPTGDAANTFDHNNTNFPLTGAHLATDCIACHAAGYAGTPTECSSCHTPDYTQSANPNHVALAIPNDCASCHTPDGWSPASFAIHNNYYALNGAHAAIANDCAACHNGDYNNTPNTCAGCHINDYNQTNNPNHAAQQFPTDCATCHSESAWVPSTFDHNSFYPLNGAHAAIANDCAACHNGNYNNTPNTCAGCHINDYNQTNNPNHAAQQFPTDCATCHSESAWAPSTFDHNSFYPLTGEHAAIANDCAACHNGNYNNTPNTCAGCHIPDYNQSTNPNHVALAIPTDCASCHTPDGWSPAPFAIHNNYYALNGAHAAIANDCAACHNGNYNNTPNTCAGCHINDYNQTNNPNHAAQQFSTDCASCHSETAWVPSTFDHNSIYALNGAHAVIANNCNACHNGNYVNTPNTCVGCHLTDYNQTNNPNHASAGFPTTCQDCHSETAWVPATFDHDNMYFPIYSGSHENAWDQCTDCHTTPGNYAVFSCTVCHINPQTNNQHQGVNGYAYASPACYSCHPDGTH